MFTNRYVSSKISVNKESNGSRSRGGRKDNKFMTKQVVQDYGLGVIIDLLKRDDGEEPTSD